MKNISKVRFLALSAIIAGLYAVLTVVLAPISFGPLQFRLSEGLNLLAFFFPQAIPGLAVGCFLANLLTGAVWLDTLIGPVATLIGAIGTYLLRRNRWLAPLPPILSNALIIPFVLAYGYGAEEAIPLMMLTVGVGEILSIYVLGMLLFSAAEPYLKKLHKN